MSQIPRSNYGAVTLASIAAFFVIVGVIIYHALNNVAEITQPTSARRTLTVIVHSDVLPVISRLAERYMESRSDLRVSVRPIKDGAALDELRNHHAQIAVTMLGREALDSTYTSAAIARDAVSLIVHRSNSIEILSDRDIADIYTGRLLNWKTVGGEDMRVTMKILSADRAATELFLRAFNVDNAVRRALRAQGDSARLIRQVAEDPEAVGVASVANARQAIAGGTPIKILPLREMGASGINIDIGRFPVVATIYAIAERENTNSVQEFMNYLVGKDAQAQFREFYFATSSNP